jgi:uncharacterized circularly permuted ATP-grasp superfamily protein
VEASNKAVWGPNSVATVRHIHSAAPSTHPTLYKPGISYDEMFAADGEVRPHYAALHARMETLSGTELAHRQWTLEQSFLMQGITFTVYGGDTTTERIIPTDLFPRIIPGAEWAQIDTGPTAWCRANWCWARRPTAAR